jgi:trehalose 6-phosphate synthase
MLQDYHLYLVPRMLRNLLRRRRVQYTLTHFVHIPWPGSDEWGFLPAGMRQPILEGLTAVDLLGFQTREDGMNFLRTVETFLPGAQVSYGRRRVHYRNHVTHVRDFPISVDVKAVQHLAESAEVQQFMAQLQSEAEGCQMIVRVDRTEPSKNIVRGFQAFGEMLDLHPEHCGQVKFYALLVPSRLDVPEYQNYHDELTAAAGWINSRHGTSTWEPVRILTGESYPRAIAALQLYDVLLVNSIADGMNLVAKEGPLVNRRDGVVVLSERTGARQQLEPGALVISPCDVYATAEAMHQALTMPAEERAVRASRLRRLVEEHDINDWLNSQLDTLQGLQL